MMNLRDGEGRGMKRRGGGGGCGLMRKLRVWKAWVTSRVKGRVTQVVMVDAGRRGKEGAMRTTVYKKREEEGQERGEDIEGSDGK